MSAPPISVVVIAKNEAGNIGRCLDSVDWCDDVVVVDDYSEDETAAMAEARGARVWVHPFESFAKQRNWALEHAGLRHPWALMLDADEAMTPEASAEAAAAVVQAGPEVVGFLMCRKTMFLGHWLRYADGFPVWIMRLVHCQRARFADLGHGEVPVPPVDGAMLKIHKPFLHYPFSRGLEHWLARHNHYSTREAELETKDCPEWTLREVIRGGPCRRKAVRNLGRNLPFRPFLRFCYHYLWKLGALDGRAGLVYSLLMANYEATIMLKRWERRLAAPTTDAGQRCK